MKYIKLYKTKAEADAAVYDENNTPNVSYCEEDKSVKYLPVTVALSSLTLEIYADRACTTRPVPGQMYEKLYAKTNRNFGFGEFKYWNYPGTSDPAAAIITPDNEDPSNEYIIVFAIDFMSPRSTNPIVKNQVYELLGQGGEQLVPENAIFSFE